MTEISQNLLRSLSFENILKINQLTGPDVTTFTGLAGLGAYLKAIESVSVLSGAMRKVN
ncbi:hypothetical protein [Lentibacillus kimchii]|uniref:hypothetical protein n=1 Tax=Lentibacillus kimchii TaxID=1542911 RepID=UPI0036D20D8F